WALVAVYLREMTTYLSTPVAAVFCGVFLLAAVTLTFEVGGYFPRGSADLEAFFAFHPWLHAVAGPAFTMRLWAEERRSGTLEFLLTNTGSAWPAVIGKFLGAWTVVAATVLLTFPLWLTTAWLGQPDHGAIVAGYVGSLLL